MSVGAKPPDDRSPEDATFQDGRQPAKSGGISKQAVRSYEDLVKRRAGANDVFHRTPASAIERDPKGLMDEAVAADPETEIDGMPCIAHPICGVSPVAAARRLRSADHPQT